MPSEYERAIEAAARDLYRVYCVEINPASSEDFNLLPEHEKRGWRAVAVKMADAISNFVLICGYNGARYQGLEQFISDK